MPWRSLALGVLFALGLPLLLSGGEPLPKPNIVFIHADDLGWSDLGCYGNTFTDTPAIDQLAREGMRFTQAYAAAPVCTPARAGLLTGQYPARLHVTGQPGYRQDARTRKLWHAPFRTDLQAGTPTIATTLAPAGYVSACIGKYGLDEPASRDGFAVNFSSSDDDVLLDHAIDFLRQRHAQPFFLYFNPHRPHEPLRPTPALAAKYRAKTTPSSRANPDYAAEVEELDRAVARILAEIDRLGTTGRTIVIFKSDNGGFLGQSDNMFTTNAPLKEGKASLYEGGIRVPLIVRWPGVIEPGSTCATPVHGVDWLPTLAEVAHVNLSSHAPCDGVSMMPLWRGAQILPRPLYWHFPHYRRAMAGIAASPSSAVRGGDWKLIYFYEDDHTELYNLADDPGETRDRSVELPAKAASLRRQLDTWRRDVGAQPPVPS